MMLSGTLLLATALADTAPALTAPAVDPLHRVLFEVVFGDFAWSITPWKIIGYGGVGLFALRWVVQALASAKAQAPTMPLAFWLMSVAGSLMLLSYFVWGKNDSVGILSNLTPSLIYSYNLYLFFRQRQRDVDPAPA